MSINFECEKAAQPKRCRAMGKKKTAETKQHQQPINALMMRLIKRN